MGPTQSRWVALLALAAVITVACGTDATGRRPASEEARPRLSATTTQTPAVESSTTTATVVAPSTTTSTTQASTTTTLALGTVERPLPVGDPTVSTFEHNDFSTDWEGYVLGLATAPLSQFNNDTGTCVLVVGVMRPTAVLRGLATSGFDTPSVSLLSDGRIVDSDVTACDRDVYEDAGFGWRLDAAVTLGTSYPFYEGFFFLDDDNPPIDAIVIGSPSDDTVRYFEPTRIDTPPDVDLLVGDPLQPDSAAISTPFIYENDGDTWDGVLQGVVEIPLGPFNSAEGTCLAIIGEITPTAIGGGSISDPFTTPPVFVVVDGYVIWPDVTQCNRDDLEAEGFGWRLDAEVTQNTTYPFYEAYFFENTDAVDLDVIIVGSASSDEARFYEPTVLDVIP